MNSLSRVRCIAVGSLTVSATRTEGRREPANAAAIPAGWSTVWSTAAASAAHGASSDPSHVMGSLVSDAAGWTGGPEGAAAVAAAGSLSLLPAALPTTASAACEPCDASAPPMPCAMLASNGAAQPGSTGSLNSGQPRSTALSADGGVDAAATEPRGVRRVPPPEVLRCDPARRRAEPGAAAAAAAALSSSSQAGWLSSADGAGATRDCVRGVVPPSFSA